MKKRMNQETLEPVLRLPQYSTCRVCRSFLSDRCGPCQSDPNLTYFEARNGITLDDLPAFPTAAFNDGMPVRMRQAVVGLYMEKLTERLQGLR